MLAIRQEWFSKLGASETGAASVIARLLSDQQMFGTLHMVKLKTAHASVAAGEAEIRHAHELEVARVGAVAPALGVVSLAMSGMTVASENPIDQTDCKTQFLSLIVVTWRRRSWYIRHTPRTSCHVVYAGEEQRHPVSRLCCMGAFHLSPPQNAYVLRLPSWP